MEETFAVANACGIIVANDVVDKCIETYKKYSPWARPAMLIDLTLGRRLELEAIIGSVIRLGEKLEVPTPVHRVIYAALKPFVDGTPKIPAPP
jgi:2-dehydropantoate 2-reductase